MDMHDDESVASSTYMEQGMSAAETQELPRVDGGKAGGKARDSRAGQGAAKETVEELKDTAGSVAGQAQQAAGQVLDRARHTAGFALQQQKTRAADGLLTAADAIRKASGELESESPIADYANSAAWQMQRFSSYLKTHELSDVVVEVERFARRQPVLFLGGGVLLGLLGARFLKSSSKQAAQDGNRSFSNTGERSGVETFTTVGDHTVEGHIAMGDYPETGNGEQVIHSTYRVPSRDGGSGEG
jgi:hypothetical protein